LKDGCRKIGHTHITTTQRYCRVSNLRAQRDYYNAIEPAMQRSQAGSRDGQFLSKKLNVADNHNERALRAIAFHNCF
jgi:hypothetical protein